MELSCQGHTSLCTHRPHVIYIYMYMYIYLSHTRDPHMPKDTPSHSLSLSHQHALYRYISRTPRHPQTLSFTLFLARIHPPTHSHHSGCGLLPSSIHPHAIPPSQIISARHLIKPGKGVASPFVEVRACVCPVAPHVSAVCVFCCTPSVRPPVCACVPCGAINGGMKEDRWLVLFTQNLAVPLGLPAPVTPVGASHLRSGMPLPNLCCRSVMSHGRAIRGPRATPLGRVKGTISVKFAVWDCSLSVHMANLTVILTLTASGIAHTVGVADDGGCAHEACWHRPVHATSVVERQYKKIIRALSRDRESKT